MPIHFLALTGAAGDVKELEYLSALMQTDDTAVRQDGTILTEDVQLFLRSRYGIDVSQAQVRERIIGRLAGGADKESVDLMDVLSMLLIPTLLKAAEEEEGALSSELIQPRSGLLLFVLNMILHDTTGNHHPKRLSKRLLQRILVAYGEPDLAMDEKLLEEMLELADSSDGHLTVDAFARGLTGDVKLYNTASETRLTSNYEDVFLAEKPIQEEPLDVSRESDATKEGSSEISGTRMEEGRCKEGEDAEQSSEASQKSFRERNAIADDIPYRFSASHIDMIAGTYRSKSLIVFCWASFILSYYALYLNVIEINGAVDYEYGGSWAENSDAIMNDIVVNIFRWLFLFVLIAIYGLIFIGIGSIGNDVHCRKAYVPAFGVIVLIAILLIPLLDPLPFQRGFLAAVSVAFAFVVVFLHLCHIVALVVPKKWIQKVPLMDRILQKQNVIGEVHTKRAGAFKLNKLVNNALSLALPIDTETVTETYFGNALQAFSKAGKQFERVGGFVWSWKRVWKGTAFSEDGIWLSARLLASNVSQFVVSAFVVVAGVVLGKDILENYDEETAKAQAGVYIDWIFNTTVAEDVVDSGTANLSAAFANFLASNPSIVDDACGAFADNSSSVDSACELAGQFYDCDPSASSNYLCTLASYTSQTNGTEDGLLSLGLLEAAGLPPGLLLETVRSAAQRAAAEAVDSLYPSERYMVTIPFVVGTIVAFFTAVSLAITYLPSVTSTTLKLRCGMIPSLRNPEFSRYRMAVDSVTLLAGSLFWGCLIASVLVGGIFGGIVFFFLWQASAVLAQQLVGVTTGILVVVLLKFVLVKSCRTPMYKAFYRKRPAAANIWNLGLECANFALSVGFVAVRCIKLIVTAALYVGRIDVPFLANGVGQWGPVELDGFPRIFLRDVLAHEAHRHPYVELIGVMYLMKLRYQDRFASRAGATWRLIFCYALMPWSNKYRIHRWSQDFNTQTERTLEFTSLRQVYVPESGSAALTGGGGGGKHGLMKENNDHQPTSTLLNRMKSSRPSTMTSTPRLAMMESQKLDDLQDENDDLTEKLSNAEKELTSLRGELAKLKGEKKRRKGKVSKKRAKLKGEKEPRKQNDL